jgi:malate dehydrogenase (oxaloacetate-decarboxylating)(NADP+)
MKLIFEAARRSPRRLVYAEGEEERVLRAAQTVVDEGLARPVLIGRRSVVRRRIEKLGLRLAEGDDYELVDPQGDRRFNRYWRIYHRLMERKGVSPDYARTVLRTRNTVIAALLVRENEADAMICGTVGRFERHLKHVLDVLGLRPGVRAAYAMNALLLPQGVFFLCDTQVCPDPSAEDLVEMTLLSAEMVRRFGMTPKIAFLSNSNFGSADNESARKMRAALELLRQRAPSLEVEGEMHGDLAVVEEVRMRLFPSSHLRGQANLLIMPTLDAANISLNLLRALGEGLSVGPMLIGGARPAHILDPTASVRGIVNLSALAAVESQSERGEPALPEESELDGALETVD